MLSDKQEKPKRRPGRPRKTDARQARLAKYGALAVDTMDRVLKGEGVTLESLTDAQFEEALAFEETQRGRMRK